MIKWMRTYHLSERSHLPILRALGVKQVDGRESSLAPLALLSYADLTAELQGAALPCSPACAADKAAVYDALQDWRKRHP